MSGRVTCLIDGCKHTTGRDVGSRWICAKHWRQLIPPRSRIRRAYHALYRRGARLGWPPEMVNRWWRFWETLEAVAQRRARDGHLDETEINRLLGW